jgi:hypothetical protein
LLGQLERGLGAGFLRALEEPDEVRELVLECVDDWSYQFDGRGDYYAQLLLAKGVDARAVEGLVDWYEPEDGEDDGGQPLALDVLARMAMRGSAGARDAVCRYVAGGARWSRLVWLVTDDDYERACNIPSWASTVRDVGVALCERFPTAPLLRDELEQSEFGLMAAALDGDPPWTLWADEHPVLAAAIGQSTLERGAADRPSPDLGSLSAEQLLAIGESGLGRGVADVLAKRSAPGDVPLLLTAARDETQPMRGPSDRSART